MATDTFGYPLDPTGTSVNNKVVGERYPFPQDLKLRVIAPKYGAFYRDGISVLNAANGVPLTYGTQYYVAYRYDVPTARFGKTVAGLIVVTDTSINEVAVNYQVLGGDFAVSAQNIVDLLKRRVSVDRSEDWQALLTPVEQLSADGPKFYKGVVSGHEIAIMAVNRLATDKLDYDPAYTDAIKTYAKTNADAIARDSSSSVQILIKQHTDDQSVHSQYARIADIAKAVPMVRPPVNQSPVDGAANVSRTSILLQGGKYFGLYEEEQSGAQFQIATDAAFTNVVFDTTNAFAGYSATFAGVLDPGRRYYWRCRYSSEELAWSDWSQVTSFVTIASGLVTPSMTKPGNNANAVGSTPVLATTAFATLGINDTHASTDWQVSTGPNGSGTVVFSSLNDTANKTSITVAANKLAAGTKYYARARHNSAGNGSSQWSDDCIFTTAIVFLPNTIGAAFQGGLFAGTVTIDRNDYAIVLAPKSTESVMALQSVNTRIAAYEVLDAVYNTSQFYTAGNSPAANYVKGLTTGSYTDWQIPSEGVLKKIFENLRPTASGIPATFATGGTEVLATGTSYWSSTAEDVKSNGTTLYQAVSQSMLDNSVPVPTVKTTSQIVRAIRLVNLKSIT